MCFNFLATKFYEFTLTTGRKITPNTGASGTKFFTLATKT